MSTNNNYQSPSEVEAWLRDCADSAVNSDRHEPAGMLTRAADLIKRLEHYEQALSAVMPPDFKDWWQNSKDEWPVVAAGVIENLRKREELAWEQLQRQTFPAPDGEVAELVAALLQVSDGASARGDEGTSWITARATRAIVAAFNERYELCGPFDDDWPELCLAAALRAAVKQLRQKYENEEYDDFADDWLNDIASELESSA